MAEASRMSRTEIAQRVRGILAYHTAIPLAELRLTTPLGAVLGSPIGLVEALGVIRNSFEISLDGGMFSDEMTVGQLIDLVEGAVGGGER